MRACISVCWIILAVVWPTGARAVITSDLAGSHSVEPGTITLGLNLDGIVSFEHREPNQGTLGSGVLISDRHILTAAHVAEAVDPLGYQVRFYLPTGILDVDLVPLRARYPEDWTSTSRNAGDIAILELAADAPADVPRYALYGLDDEVGKPIVVAGHGGIGTGMVGGLPLLGDQVLHAGLNRIEARGEDLSDEIHDAAPGDLLVFDFDSGASANNVLGMLGLSSDLGFGADEVGVYIGDSGGPTFIDGAVAGVHRAIYGGLDGDYTTEEDGSWGELGFATRVSSFRDFIMSATDGQAVFLPGRGTWNIDGNGNWSTAANWTTGVPNAAGSPAVFGPILTSPRTVTVDAPVAVGRIDFDSEFAYTIAGDGPITLDAVGGDAVIHVVSGNHVVAAPITLADNTVITITPAAGSLSIVGAINASGVNIAKAGEGMLTVNSIRAQGLSVNGGTVALAASNSAPDANISVVNSLTIAGIEASTAKLDLTDNAAIIDYTGTSPAATIRQQILDGRGGAGLGAEWSGQGITSSSAAAANILQPELYSVGYAENAAMPLGPLTTFHGQPVDDTSILLTYARTGDANLDGVVNDDDVTIVGASYAPGVPQAAWALGDFDFNGFVDDDDITLLGAFYDPAAAPLVNSGSVSSGSVSSGVARNASLAAVPEPGPLLLLVVGSLCLALLFKRRYEAE